MPASVLVSRPRCGIRNLALHVSGLTQVDLREYRFHESSSALIHKDDSACRVAEPARIYKARKKYESAIGR